MLHRLEIENFYSIRDPQVIDLRVAANVTDDSGRLAPLWVGATDRAPKVVALFGANASGKSNVLKALSFVAWFVKDSFSAHRRARLPFDRFNDDPMLQAPTRLAVHLSGPEALTDQSRPEAVNCRYAYEVRIGGGATPRIDHESLQYWPDHASRSINLFKRDSRGRVSAGRQFGLGNLNKYLQKILRPDASVISTLAQLEHPFSKIIWDLVARFSSNILINRHEGSDDATIQHYAAHPQLVERLNRDLERIDLGLREMQIRFGSNGPLAYFVHEGFPHAMPLTYESEGTRQFLRIYPLILQALQTGSVAVIDEIDAMIHPMLLPEVMRWFYDPARNPLDGQLWMSCQNASLLEDLSKEEIWFCQKNDVGRTRIYGLREIKAVRRVDNYHRKYLSGAYGAVPRIG